MAKVKYTFNETKKGLWCTGQVTLFCGHTITEKFLGRDKDELMFAVKTNLDLQIVAHTKRCKK